MAKVEFLKADGWLFAEPTLTTSYSWLAKAGNGNGSSSGKLPNPCPLPLHSD